MGNVKLKTAALKLVSKDAATSFLSRWILKDLELHGKLTGWPFDYAGKGDFPVEGKMRYVEKLAT